MAESLSRRHPAEPDAAVLLGTLYLLQNAHGRAVPVLARALEVHPQDLDLLNTLAMAYVRMGDQAKAEHTFRKIMAQEPTVFDHHVKLALFFDQQQRYDKAEGVLREALRLDQDNEQRHLALADYVVGRRSLDAAGPSCRRPITCCPMPSMCSSPKGGCSNCSVNRHKPGRSMKTSAIATARNRLKTPQR